MTETNKFLPVGSKDIYDDGIGKVTLYDTSHANESEEQRIWTVTTIASLAYGNEEAKNPEALYERMKSIKHESLWEFIRHGLEEHSTTHSSMRRFMSTNVAFPLSDFSRSHKSNIACFRIKVPLFVRAQFMRHRSFSYLEMSRRYTKDAKVPFEFWFPNDTHEDQRAQCVESYMQTYSFMTEVYHTQIASRFLPQTTYTEFYVMGEVVGLKNFFKLRLDEHAQLEIRQLAEAMLALLDEHQLELATTIKGEE